MNYPYTIPQALLAEKICTSLGYDKIFYQNSGAEANEAMIKMARKYGIETYGPDRYHIITAKESFHGRTFGALSATGQPDSACHRGFGPMLPGFSYAEFNNLEAFKAQVTPDTIAIMLEPIQGEGGVHSATPEFMAGIKKLCEEKNLLLLIDEIQTGWCRTGEVMAYMHYGLKPDIVSMAKATSSGFPISAICTSDKIAKAKETGAYFMEKLRGLPRVANVRGKGLLIGVEFDGPIGLDVKHGCFDRKLLVTLIGSKLIRMIPPLIATREDCNKACAILEESIKATK